MPQSRKRHGHHDYKKPAEIPGRQRAKGRIMWAILFGVFGLLIAIFAAGINYIPIFTGLIAGALIGYVAGKKMEKEA
ncbi:MAG TPA: hypothetical protein VGO09_10445 [Flavisolibacter sp.]|jgi:hypothetical protein|nr:hypothetical protein [Flavisolibacter sp.]